MKKLTSAAASLAARKRLERCWFILARGATPSAYNNHTSYINHPTPNYRIINNIIK